MRLRLPAWLPRRLPPIPTPTIEEWGKNAALRRATLSDAALSLWFAGCFWAGGWDRVAGNAFATLRDSGGPYVWAPVFAATAVWLLASLFWSARAAALALRWGTTPIVVFGLMVWHAAVNDHQASYVGVGLAGYAAFQAVSRSDLYQAAHHAAAAREVSARV